MSSIVADLIDLFPDTITAVPGSKDYAGNFIASGSTLLLPCLIEGEARIVRDTAGVEVTSTVQAIIAGYNNLHPSTYRFRLPTRYIPNGTEPGTEGGLRAISVDKVSDEDGPCYEHVYFP